MSKKTSSTPHFFKDRIVILPLHKIQPNDYNPNEMPRETYEVLKRDMKTHGLYSINPILVRPLEGKNYEIIDGESRWRAANELGWIKIRCIIKNVSLEEAKRINYTKNRERGSLNPFKEAKLFSDDLRTKSYRELSNLYGVTTWYIQNRVKLLNLHREVKELYTRVYPLITPSHLELLTSLPQNLQTDLAQNITQERLSVRNLESIIKEHKLSETLKELIKDLHLSEETFMGTKSTPEKHVKITYPEDFEFFDYIPFNTRVIPFLPQRKFLLSIYSGWLDVALKGRNLIEKLFIDSGMISALRRGHVEFSNYQSKIVKIAKVLKANVLCHLDVPMHPSLAEKCGLTHEKELEITIRNAETFLKTDFEGTKCFSVQGWTLNQYEHCIKRFEELEIFDNDEHWIGFGTTCMRRPPGLYEVYQHCIPIIKKINPKIHIHAFGIAKPEWVAHLHTLGVDSSDSASPILTTVFNKWITINGKEIKFSERRSTSMRDSQLIHNYWIFHLLLNKFLKRGVGGA